MRVIIQVISTTPIKKKEKKQLNLFLCYFLIQVFTLPSPTDITLTPFWVTVRHVDNFLLQKSHAPGNPIFKSLLSTIANV